MTSDMVSRLQEDGTLYCPKIMISWECSNSRLIFWKYHPKMSRGQFMHVFHLKGSFHKKTANLKMSHYCSCSCWAGYMTDGGDAGGGWVL